MTERTAAETFVDGSLRASADLTGLATNGIHAEEVTPGLPTPYVVFSMASSGTKHANGRVRVESWFIYNVRFTQEGNGEAADVAAEAIDVALCGGDFRTVEQNGYRIDCIQVGELTTPSTQTGRQYRYAGARYRITVRRLIDHA